MNQQRWVIRAVSSIFLLLTLLIINEQVESLLYITTVGLGFFLFGYVERLLEEKGAITQKGNRTN